VPSDRNDRHGDGPPSSATRPYLSAFSHLADAESVTDEDAVSQLRPYLLTSGRAEPVDETLEIEAQVATTELGDAALAQLAFEQRDIVRLCATAISVAEVAARLKLHIGVARVLVADLAAVGYLLVERPSLPNSQDPDLIERVIRGLEAIR
jgi:Protein of unknown function (DUF742)